MADAAFPYCGWTPFHRLLISLTPADLNGDFSAKDIERILVRAQHRGSGGHLKQALFALGFIDSSKRGTPALARCVAAADADRRAILREQLRMCYFPNSAAPPPEAEIAHRLKTKMAEQTAAKAMSFFSGAAKWAELYDAPEEDPQGSLLFHAPGVKVRLVIEGNTMLLPRAVLTAVHDVTAIFGWIRRRPESATLAAEFLALIREALDAASATWNNLLTAMRKLIQPRKKGFASEVAEMPRRNRFGK